MNQNLTRNRFTVILFSLVFIISTIVAFYPSVSASAVSGVIKHDFDDGNGQVDALLITNEEELNHFTERVTTVNKR